MFAAVVLGAVLSLVAVAGLVVLTLRRAPLVFVADKLPGTLYDDPDEFVEPVAQPEGSDETRSARADAGSAGGDGGNRREDETSDDA